MMRMCATFLVVAMTVIDRVSERHHRDDAERGDVPAWVMIVVMTAALVIAILIPFREAIVNAVKNALDSVTGT